jgi:hypothetical protein
VQFDNQLTRVQNNIKTVNKYMAEKLCRVQGTAVTALQGKDQSTTFNHQSTVRLGNVPSSLVPHLDACRGLASMHMVLHVHLPWIGTHACLPLLGIASPTLTGFALGATAART